MQKHSCKLCFKRFDNGRSLGGHMRFHMMHPSLAQKNKDQEESNDVDHQDSCFPVETSSDLLQDSESETESLMKTESRKSKRVIKSRIPGTKFGEPSWFVDNESESSISGISHDEDVAYCLMMLSRDKWNKEEDEKSEDFGVIKLTKVRKRGGDYRCETCDKMFKSYQALGGHRANHKRIKLKKETEKNRTEEAGEGKVVEREHKCPICYRVFASGQALGGHKRSHLTKSAREDLNLVKPFSREIDLNLPATLDDDDDDDNQINQM